MVVYIYLLIGTSSFDLCILLSFPETLIEFDFETNSYHFFFRAVAFDFFKGDGVDEVFFLLGPLWLLILSSLFLALGLAEAFRLGSLPFRY